MRVMFDTNILLDVFQNANPITQRPQLASIGHCTETLRGGPAHVLTTFYYVLKKHAGAYVAREAVTWLLKRFRVAPCEHGVLEKACQCEIVDYEDAVVAMAAENAGCTHVLTRNLSDFVKSPVPALSPEELLEKLNRP